MLTALLNIFLVAAPTADVITSVADSNWCMGPADAQHNAQVRVSACSQSTTRWQRHGYELRVNGKCLDNSNGRSNEGNPGVLWDCNGGANQRWVLQNKQIVLFGGSQCITAKEDSRSSAGVLVLGACSDTAAQQWQWPAAWDHKPAVAKDRDKDKNWLHSSGAYPPSFVTQVQYSQREFVSVQDSIKHCREFCWKNPNCAGFFEQTHLCPNAAANDGLTNPNVSPGEGCYRICGFYDRGDNPLWGRTVAGPVGSVWIKAETFRADGVQTPQSFFDGPFSVSAGP